MKYNNLKFLILLIGFIFIVFLFSSNIYSKNIPLVYKVSGDVDLDNFALIPCGATGSCKITYKINTSDEFVAGDNLTSSQAKDFLTQGFFIGPFKSSLIGNEKAFNVSVFLYDNDIQYFSSRVLVPNPSYDDSKELVADDLYTNDLRHNNEFLVYKDTGLNWITQDLSNIVGFSDHFSSNTVEVSNDVISIKETSLDSSKIKNSTIKKKDIANSTLDNSDLDASNDSVGRYLSSNGSDLVWKDVDFEYSESNLKSLFCNSINVKTYVQQGPNINFTGFGVLGSESCSINNSTNSIEVTYNSAYITSDSGSKYYIDGDSIDGDPLISKNMFCEKMGGKFKSINKYLANDDKRAGAIDGPGGIVRFYLNDGGNLNQKVDITCEFEGVSK